MASTDNLENMNINIRDQLDMLIDGMNGLPGKLTCTTIYKLVVSFFIPRP